MRRRANADDAADLRPVNNTFQTITAAADAIATVDHRFPRATAVQVLFTSLHLSFNHLEF